jgi:hypothetical protein
MTAVSIKPVRCAIYTRVSTDQGLDQDFNSLDAQHEASQAYIGSLFSGTEVCEAHRRHLLNAKKLCGGGATLHLMDRRDGS